MLPKGKVLFRAGSPEYSKVETGAKKKRTGLDLALKMDAISIF